MKKYLIKIFSVFLAAWMITITGGLHVYAHECSCCDVQEVSLVSIEQCCSNDAPLDICCDNEQEQYSSCSEEPLLTSLVESTTCPTHNCCTVSYSYLKLNESFTTAEKILLKPCPVLSKVVQALNTEVLPENDFHNLAISNNSFPPGLTGKAFLIFAHTLKIPLSL